MQFITDPKHRNIDPNYLEPGNSFKVINGGRGFKCNPLRIRKIEFSDGCDLQGSKLS